MMRLQKVMPRSLWRASVSAIVLMGSMWIAGLVLAQEVQAQDKKPNILVIWGDDIGQSNLSAYTMGLMGYRTPNIDRIAREGMIFTDYYGEQSKIPFLAHVRDQSSRPSLVLSLPKDVYIAGADKQATDKALEATHRTTVGVMDSQGNILRPSTRKR